MSKSISSTGGLAVPPAVRKLKKAAESARGARPLTARGVADLCGVELKTVHNWAVDGRIDHFRTPGRHLRFEATAVLQFLEACGYQVPTSAGIGSVLVVAKGSVKSRLKRALKSTQTDYADNVFAALVVAGKKTPDAVVLESALLAELPHRAILSALVSALPSSKIFCVGPLSRVPRGVRCVGATDLTELSEALGLL